MCNRRHSILISTWLGSREASISTTPQSTTMPGCTWATSTTTVREVAFLAWQLANLIFQDANSTDVEVSAPSFRKALFITDPSVDRQSLIDKKGQRVAGTCEWLERNETYKAWLCGDPSLLWIFGGPGKGKTMLSIYLTQRFEKLHNGEVIYFFCSSEHPTRSTATAILRTLLWQMIVTRPEVTKLISPYSDPPERIQRDIYATPKALCQSYFPERMDISALCCSRRAQLRRCSLYP